MFEERRNIPTGSCIPLSKRMFVSYGLGMGLGFTLALTLIGAVRELLGTGCVFGLNLYSETYGMLIFVLAPGAFIVLGYLMALVQKLLKK